MPYKDILNKTQFSNPRPGTQLESAKYNNDINLLITAANTISTRELMPSDIKLMINQSIADTHKQIAGSKEFDTWQDFMDAKASWDAGNGINIIDANGALIHYTKDIAKLGDIIFVSSTKTSVDDQDYFYPEEIIIKNANKDAELLTQNNENAKSI